MQYTSMTEDLMQVKPKRTGLKVLAAIMAVALFAMIGFIAMGTTPAVEAGKEEMSLANYNWGCGNTGRCWSYCNTGNGWCYTSKVGYCWKKSHCQQNWACQSKCYNY